MRFDEETDDDILMELGIQPGSYTRQLSLNAFDEPDEDFYEQDSDDGTDTGYSLGGFALNETEINGSYHAGSAFAGKAFATPDPISYTAETTVNSAGDFRKELSLRLDQLEAALQITKLDLPPRNHNHPPDLITDSLLSTAEYKSVMHAISELRQEIRNPQPDPVNLEEQASALRKATTAIIKWIARKADLAIDQTIIYGVPIVIGAYAIANPNEVRDTLSAAAHVAVTWAQILTP